MSISKEILQKYKKYGNVLIETGSYEGDTIQLGLDLGFMEVHSIELSEKLYSKCKDRFDNVSGVYLYQGDSLKILPEILEKINSSCVFWLDSHFSFGETAMGELYCPLYQELNIIANHSIKNHCILIDDVRLFETEFNIKIDTVKQFLKDINSKYKFSFDEGRFKNDILIAHI